MKLVSKQRQGSRVSRKYDRAQTPYQRLVVSEALPQEQHARLDEFYRGLNPVELLDQLERLQDAFWQHARPAPRKLRLATRHLQPKPESSPPLMPETQVLPAGDESVLLGHVKRRYRRSERPRAPRTWRTRENPLAEVTGELRQWLMNDPDRTAKSLFEELHGRYPEQIEAGQLRTLQRRVKEWRRDILVTFDEEWLRVSGRLSPAVASFGEIR